MTNNDHGSENKKDKKPPIMAPPNLDVPKLPKFLRFKKRMPRQESNMLAMASSIGLALVFAILLGLALGYWLDKQLGTKPWLTLLCLLLGIIAGFKNIFIISARIEKKQEELKKQKHKVEKTDEQK